jgi:hypothetical protein
MDNFDLTSWRRERDETQRKELQQLRTSLLLKPIRSLYETEHTIMIAIEGDIVLRFDAMSQCCDASWFVLSDIDKPAGIEGALITGYREIPAEELRKIGGVTGGSVTYGFNIDTTAGTYHVRMANDHCESGCYSGELSRRAYLTGYTHHEDIYHVREEYILLQPFSCAE